MTVSYQKWYVGQTYPSMSIPLTTDTVPENITGVDVTKFSMIFRTDGGVDTTGTGTFSVRVLYPAEVLYKPSVADVASVFSGTLVVESLRPPSGTTADKAVYDAITFVISAD